MRHKKTYFLLTENKEIKQIVLIRRKRHFRNKLNKIMYWAWQYKWDRAMYLKYDDYDTND